MNRPGCSAKVWTKFVSSQKETAITTIAKHWMSIELKYRNSNLNLSLLFASVYVSLSLSWSFLDLKSLISSLSISFLPIIVSHSLRHSLCFLFIYFGCVYWISTRNMYNGMHIHHTSQTECTTYINCEKLVEIMMKVDKKQQKYVYC